jgi:hypothetical protein
MSERGEGAINGPKITMKTKPGLLTIDNTLCGICVGKIG